MVFDILHEVEKANIAGTLSELISIPSYESEKGIVEYISKRLDRLNVRYDIREVAPSRQNLIAYTGGKGKSLILNTHTDTVPPGNPENWDSDPLKPVLKGDKLLGLGSCDAKASLASMMTAFEIIARNSSILNGTLIFQAVCCEESRARGTLAEVAHGITADAAIIGEPTGLVPMIGHKGAIGLEISVSGKSAHGSSPEKGINAISNMAAIIKLLDSLADKVSKRHNPLIGNASLAVTTIHGGQAPNVIPDSCIITVDRRLIPSETIKTAWNEILAIIEEEKSVNPSLSASVKEGISIEPCIISQEEPIVKNVVDSIYKVTGENRKVSGFTACCDMWCLVQRLNIPTLILGPGDLSMAHKANESISIDELYEAAKIYLSVALNWLG